jgi:signal transduction histidine kinase
MAISRSLRRWLPPIAVGAIGVVVSSLAFWVATEIDDRRIRNQLDFRSEWRARDIEAKVRLAGNAVDNIANSMAANPDLDAAQFDRIATRARQDLDHVNALQWAPRVPRADIAAFERSAISHGLPGYHVFNVDRSFQPTELADRADYFPVLFDMRFEGSRQVTGLALGRYEGRRVPMEKARDEGRPVATLPVRPVGPKTADLVYLLFWPVYDGIDVPATVDARRAMLRGYAIANYNLAALLAAAMRDTPEIGATIHFAIAAAHQENPVENAALVYSAASGKIEPPAATGATDPPAMRTAHQFDVFDQHWDLTFDYSPAAVAQLRSHGAWGWLLAGLLLTASLVVYVARQRGRSAAVEALADQRTAELQNASAQLQHAQKMEIIGSFTGGMAHDFNNLLAIIIGNLDILRRRAKDDDEIRELADEALDAATRGADLTQRLLAFARRQPLRPQRVELNQLITEITKLLRRTLGEDIEVTLTLAPDVWPVVIDRAQLEAALANLATNARDAMPSGGHLTIATTNRRLDSHYAAAHADVVAGNYAVIEVSDTGSGMSAETAEKIFDPFFTTKDEGKGTGLGLSMVYGLMKQSGGHVAFYSEPGVGTTFRLYLPRVEAAATEAAQPVAADDRRGNGETVLAVEDNPSLRRVVVRQLHELGYRVIEADNAAAALTVLQRQPVDVLFTDVVMGGGITGLDLAETVEATWPNVRVLVTSGFPDGKAGNAGARRAAPLLSKPYRREELAKALRQALDA